MDETPIQLGPDEVVTFRHNAIVPKFGGRRRCEPSTSTAPVPVAASSSARCPEPAPQVSKNNNENKNNDYKEPKTSTATAPAAAPTSNLLFQEKNPEAARAPRIILRSGAGRQQEPRTRREYHNVPRRTDGGGHHRGGRDEGIGGGGFGRRNVQHEPEVELTPEALEKMKLEFDELAEQLNEEKNALPKSPEEEYMKRVFSKDAIKMYSAKDFGYKILKTERSQKERKEINQANLEMMMFVYQDHREKVDQSQMDKYITNRVAQMTAGNGKKNFRHGTSSLIIDFDNYPPGLKSRSGDGETSLPIYLRPVVIDGIAVQNVSTHDLERAFFQITQKARLCSDTSYIHDLTLSVKPLFDMIMTFLIRGHKTVVCLPMYYQNYVTPGKISKVDDVVAFKALIDLKFIEFHDYVVGQDRKTWFKYLAGVVDDRGAVFVSSDDYVPKDWYDKYEKQSERVLTPCSLNTDDRLLVIQPTIRHKKKQTEEERKNGVQERYVVIPADTILNYEITTDGSFLQEQLFLEHQVENICSLCQLYPMRSMHKIGIKQLLYLVVRAQSPFKMPYMELDDYYTLRANF